MPEFLPTFWNTKTQHNGSSRTSKVSGGQIAYKKKSTDWSLLNTDIQDDGVYFSVTAFPGNAQMPANAQDWMDLNFDSQYSAKRQITEGNWSHSEDAFEMRMRTDCPTNSVGIIHPDKPWQVIYYNAFGQGANLIYGIWRGRATRVEHVIEITEMPSGNSEYLTYDFYIQSNDATTFVGANLDQRPWSGNSGDAATVEGFDVFLAKGDDPATVRGSVLRTPVCWWANIDGTLTRKNVRVDFEIQPDGITVKATKYVKRSDIAEALSQGVPYRADATFNPDANPETSSADGRTRRNGTESWSAKRDGAGLFFDDASSAEAVWISMAGTTDNYDLMDRLFYWLDTSSIGSGQSIDSGDFGFTTSNINTGDIGMEVNLCGSTSSNTTSVAAADYQTASFSPLYSDTSITATSAGTFTRNTLTLNQDGRDAVNVTGLTRFCLGCSNYDFADSEPTWVSSGDQQLGVYMSEQGTAGRDPELTVTHSAAGPAMPILIRHYDNMRAK